MFVHNIDSVLLQIGPLQIRYYGLVLVFGFLATYYTLSKSMHALGLTKDNVSDLVLYLIAGAILGARVFEILIWEPGYYFSNPLKMIALWEGGLSFHGGLAGVAIASYIYCRKKRLSLAKLSDILAIPAVFFLALGRIANFINAELVGTVTNLPWCVQFPGADSCRHPVQLYGALKRFIIFGVLLFIKKKPHKDGFIFWNFILLMGIGRFAIDFLREDARLLWLSAGQYMSLLMVIIALIVLKKYYARL